MADLSWVTCDGGPHILIPEDCEAFWEGSSAPSKGRVVHAQFRWNADPGAVATDYDAACDINDLVGVIAVGASAAVVSGDEVPMSAWVPSALFAGGLLVVPMTWPEADALDERLVAATNSAARSEFSPTGLLLPPSSGKFILCAACDSGPNWIYPTARVTIPGIPYQILSAEVRTEEFWLRLHALHAAV